MNKGRFEHKRVRKHGGKALALVLALVLLIGSVVGGTLAWLTDNSGPVTNTFTESNIEIELDEEKPENKEAQMVPGWTIDKNPKVTVTATSEDCWLFVKITESTNPDLDTYIAYQIADLYDVDKNSDGWQIIQNNNDSEIVIGRKVYKDDDVKAFDILGAGTYTDPMGTPDDTSDDFEIRWEHNQVGVKPSVTDALMEAIVDNEPTLSFEAYAVQLFKTNSNNDRDDINDEFTAAEAWARAGSLNSGN